MSSLLRRAGGARDIEQRHGCMLGQHYSKSRGRNVEVIPVRALLDGNKSDIGKVIEDKADQSVKMAFRSPARIFNDFGKRAEMLPSLAPLCGGPLPTAVLRFKCLTQFCKMVADFRQCRAWGHKIIAIEAILCREEGCAGCDQ